jgi:hypothetical protein
MTDVVASVSEGGASASTPLMQATQPAPTDFKSQLGEFASDPTFEPFKDLTSLAKSYKETKSLVGKKFTPPSSDATPEEKASFYKSLGVPDSVDGYGLAAPDNLPEELKDKYDGESLKEFASAAHKLNLTPEQAKGLQAWYDERQISELERFREWNAAEDVKFQGMMEKSFGGGMDKALAATSAALNKYVPEEMRGAVLDAPAHVIAAFAHAINGMQKEYGAEDRGPIGSSHTPAQSAQELRAELHKVIASKEYTNPMASGKSAHEEARRKANELSTRIAGLGKK